MDLYERIDANKALIDKERPFEGETLKILREYYRIGLTWTSNALEGNTLSEIETKVLLEDGITCGGKPLRDIFEAVGHSRAFDYMFSLLRGKLITTKDIRELHRLFYLSIDEDNAGNWRKVRVYITGSDHVFPQPKELHALMDGLAEWMDTERDRMHPVKFAAMLHLKFVTIHPFVDGNGRVARLLTNTALIQAGYLLAIVPPILRRDYISAIHAYQDRNDAEPFCNLIAGQVLETEKDIMRFLDIKE